MQHVQENTPKIRVLCCSTSNVILKTYQFWENKRKQKQIFFENQCFKSLNMVKKTKNKTQKTKTKNKKQKQKKDNIIRSPSIVPKHPFTGFLFTHTFTYLSDDPKAVVRGLSFYSLAYPTTLQG